VDATAQVERSVAVAADRRLPGDVEDTQAAGIKPPGGAGAAPKLQRAGCQCVGVRLAEIELSRYAGRFDGQLGKGRVNTAVKPHDSRQRGGGVGNEDCRA
jgi:hypothetical protein